MTKRTVPTLRAPRMRFLLSFYFLFRALPGTEVLPLASSVARGGDNQTGFSVRPSGVKSRRRNGQ